MTPPRLWLKDRNVVAELLRPRPESLVAAILDAT